MTQEVTSFEDIPRGTLFAPLFDGRDVHILQQTSSGEIQQLCCRSNSTQWGYYQHEPSVEKNTPVVEAVLGELTTIREATIDQIFFPLIDGHHAHPMTLSKGNVLQLKGKGRNYEWVLSRLNADQEGLKVQYVRLVGVTLS